MKRYTAEMMWMTVIICYCLLTLTGLIDDPFPASTFGENMIDIDSFEDESLPKDTLPKERVPKSTINAELEFLAIGGAILAISLLVYHFLSK